MTLLLNPVQGTVPEILNSFLMATQFDPGWYKAWHTWAMANYALVANMESKSEARVVDIPGMKLAAHVVQAIKGLVCSKFLIL